MCLKNYYPFIFVCSLIRILFSFMMLVEYGAYIKCDNHCRVCYTYTKIYPISSKYSKTYLDILLR